VLEIDALTVVIIQNASFSKVCVALESTAMDYGCCCCCCGSSVRSSCGRSEIARVLRAEALFTLLWEAACDGDVVDSIVDQQCA
jgi:hypothetical protein